MNRIQLEHIIRAASQISGDPEIVVIGSQAIHAQRAKLPPIAFQSPEADVYSRNHPERADLIDAAIGELSQFHKTHRYDATASARKPPSSPPGGSSALFQAPERTTHVRPASGSWHPGQRPEFRGAAWIPACAGMTRGASLFWPPGIIPISGPNTGGATGQFVDAHALALSKYVAGREQDIVFNRELARHGIVSKRKLTRLLPSMPIDDERRRLILDRIKLDFAAASPRRSPKQSTS